MRQECRECFPRHRLQRKPLVSDPGMHHGMCVTHVAWCMSGSLTRGGGENVPGIPGACATRNFTYLLRGPWTGLSIHETGYLYSALDYGCARACVCVCAVWHLSTIAWTIILRASEYSLSGKPTYSYHQSSWRLEAARLYVIMIKSLWNLTGILTALLPGCQSNF